MRGLLTFSILILLLILPSCESGPSPSPSGKTVKIGVIAPFRGPDAEWGESGLKGVEIALKMQPYLSNGDKVELVVGDDRNNPEMTLKIIQKLVLKDNVSAVLIFSDSADVLAISEQAEKYKTPILVLLSTHPGVTNDWVSQFLFDDATQGSVAALYVIDELLIEHVAIIEDSEDPHSVYLANEFTRRFEAAHGKVERLTVQDTSADFGTFLNGFKRKGIKFLYLPLGADKVVEVERASREQGWHPQVMVSDGLLSTIRLQYADDLSLVDGMMATDVYSSDLPFTEYGKKASKIYRNTFNLQGTSFEAIGSEGTSLLLAAMDECADSANRGCINHMLRNNDSFEGLISKIRIKPDGKAERPIYINRISGNHLEFVVKIY